MPQTKSRAQTVQNRANVQTQITGLRFQLRLARQKSVLAHRTNDPNAKNLTLAADEIESEIRKLQKLI